MKDKFVVLSLGWGVQSMTLATMAALGEIRIDAAVNADTTWESFLTYQYAKKWTPWLEEHDVNVVTVTPRKNEIMLGENKVVDIPAFTHSPKGKGQIRRQCTGGWKIVPIRRWLQKNRMKLPVEMMIGISTDEALRMKPSGVKYVNNVWPLIDLGMSRKDCEKYLDAHGIEVPTKSACVFCPYHNFGEWRRIKETPEDWARAVQVDKQIRDIRPPNALFVHPARKPLEEIDFRNQEEKGQIRLWNEECTGICGI